MKVLAIDTSGTPVSAALIDEQLLLGEYFVINKSKTHSRNLFHIIQTLLRDVNLSVNDIDLFAVTKGPGSFTGLRIGITAAKTMAYALNKSIIGVTTLDVLAHNITFCNNIICPIIDAKNNQVYTALYEWTSSDKIPDTDSNSFSLMKNNAVKEEQNRISEYIAISIKDLVLDIRKRIEETGKEIIFTGDGVISYADFFLNELGLKCKFAPNNLLFQRASSTAEIALERFVKGEEDNPFDLVPFYLRKSQAERMREFG